MWAQFFLCCYFMKSMYVEKMLWHDCKNFQWSFSRQQKLKPEKGHHRKTSISQDGNGFFVWSFHFDHNCLQNIRKIIGLQGHHRHHCPWHADDQIWLCLMLVQHSSWEKSTDEQTHVWHPCSPFQEIFEIGLRHLSSQLTCLSHLAQHCLNLNWIIKKFLQKFRDCLLPFLRFSQLDRVQPSSGFLVQHLNIITSTLMESRHVPQSATSSFTL